MSEQPDTPVVEVITPYSILLGANIIYNTKADIAAEVLGWMDYIKNSNVEPENFHAKFGNIPPSALLAVAVYNSTFRKRFASTEEQKVLLALQNTLWDRFCSAMAKNKSAESVYRLLKDHICPF